MGYPAVGEAVVMVREVSPGDKRLVGSVVARHGQGLLSNFQSDDSTKKVSSK